MALVALCVAVFARTIGFGLFQDDYLLARPWSTRHVLDAFHGPFDPTNYNDAYFRPLASLSFALEWRVWGTSRWGYHLTNIALHTAVVVALWAVLRRLRVSAWAALAGAAFFAIVPANAATVVYIAERTDAMVALCVLLAMLCLHKYDTSPQVLWLVLLNVLFVVAFLAKEVAFAMVPIVAVYWLYLRVERREPIALAAAGEQPSMLAHWRNEARIILRSIVDRSERRGWLLTLGPLLGVALAALAYRTAVMPADSFGDRFAESQSPPQAFVEGVRSVIRGTPWEISGLPFLPLLAAFGVGFILRPRSRAWRVVLLGFGIIVCGVAPLSFSGGVEPRLLYVAEIGMGVAIAGLAMVFIEAVTAARSNQRNLLGIGAVVAAVSLVAIGAVAVSQVRAQDVYEPGSPLQLQKDLLVWVHPSRDSFIPADNVAEIKRHLLEAGAIDANGNLLVEVPERATAD